MVDAFDREDRSRNMEAVRKKFGCTDDISEVYSSQRVAAVAREYEDSSSTSALQTGMDMSGTFQIQKLRQSLEEVGGGEAIPIGRQSSMHNV